MATKGDYYTGKGNGVRYNRAIDQWQLIYRPHLFIGGTPDGNLGPLRFMNFDQREDAIKVLEKMESDGNA